MAYTPIKLKNGAFPLPSSPFCKRLTDTNAPQFFWLRFKHVIYPLVVSILAHILALSTTGTVPRYFAMMLLPSSLYASAIITLMWMSVRVSNPPHAIYIVNGSSNLNLIFIGFIANTRPHTRDASCCNCISECRLQFCELRSLFSFPPSLDSPCLILSRISGHLICTPVHPATCSPLVLTSLRPHLGSCLQLLCDRI